MAFLLDRISAAARMVNPNGTVSQWFQRLWQKTVEQIEAQEAAQDAVINRIRRINSHTDPTTILKATENGAACSIQVLNHTRVYADGTTIAITGSTTGSLLGDTMYGCYYDDDTLADTTPTFVFTTDLATAQAASAEGRHWCGAILTPALSSGDTIESGGAYPAGSAFGGELL